MPKETSQFIKPVTCRADTLRSEVNSRDALAQSIASRLLPTSVAVMFDLD